MAMKTSRKGVRLNEACYFPHYPPHTRKKMSVLRVIPKNLISKSANKLDPTSDNNSQSKKIEKIIFNQQSEEIATFTYTDHLESESSVYSEKERTINQEIQTVVEFHQSDCSNSKISHLVKDRGISSEFQLSPRHEVSSKHEISSHVEITPRLEDSSLQDISFTLQFSPSRNNLSQTEMSSNHDKFVALKGNKISKSYLDDDHLKKDSWWRNFFREVIVDFFLQLLGKNSSRKKSGGNMTEKFLSVATSTNNKEQRNGKKCKSKRYLNSYEDDQHKRRVTYGKGDKLFFDLIRLTQDENLRAIILEQALRTRILEEENARFRKKLAEKLKTRQNSSPFY